MGDDLGRWEPFDVATVRELFEPTGATWWVSGGVALDLFLGYVSRPHGDIDVSVRRADWQAVAPRLTHLLDVHIAKAGELVPLSRRAVTGDVHNLWAREHGGAAWRMQVNLELGDDVRWVYRRDRRVTRPWPRVIRRDREVPYADPAVQLLWKARDVTAKDQLDLDAVLPRLGPDDRQWLAAAIACAHPASPWRARI